MKFLSDFDGVLTLPVTEMSRVGEIFRDILQSVDPHASELINECASDIRSEPHKHGWYFDNRITAYSNEDGFIFGNALGAELDRRCSHDARAASLRLALQDQGLQSFTDAAFSAYTRMTRETAQATHKPLDPAVRTLFLRVLNAGHDIVVVSNSKTDRIIQMFEASDLSHPRLRVRGDARKFILGSGTGEIAVGEYTVLLDRPHYAQILNEELPDVVIGDVFSLDLAIVLGFKHQRRPEFRNTRLCLRQQAYTPQWSLEFLSQPSNKELNCVIVDSLSAAFIH